ncbi:MAG: hypothetical protein CL678_06410 [Bdellovibrionaceae bacterium]|nr:hypothetical protein [Pseudobdellovibrionaceae bacterium]|tara:strand:+ start:1063 stop:1986 length:924 start_codon:yes stop_codon:yes gene_type:complete
MNQGWIMAAIFGGINLCQAHIFGEDSRIDAFEIQSSFWREKSKAVVAIRKKGVFNRNPHLQSLSIKHALKTLKEEKNLCSGESFEFQYSLSECSGVLVAPDLVLTAGHCVKDHPCNGKGIEVYTDFEISDPHSSLQKLHRDQSHACIRKIHTEYPLLNGTNYMGGQDIALIQISPPIKDRNPVSIDYVGSFEPQASVRAMGFPSGIPLKQSRGFFKGISAPNQMIWTDVDTVKGSSGSPLFKESDGNLIGIITLSDQKKAYQKKKYSKCSRLIDCEKENCKMWNSANSLHSISKVLQREIALSKLRN